MPKRREEEGHISGTGSVLFVVTACAVLPLAIYVIHELGHMIVQLLLNVPVVICLKGINLSTTCGGYILSYPLPVVFAVGVAGLAASLLPYGYVKNLVFIPDAIKKRRERYVNLAILAYYVALCFGMFTQDFLVIVRKLSIG